MTRDLRDQLDNWGRGMRYHAGHSRTAWSAEGMYRSPQCWYPPAPRPPQADMTEAWRVEWAWKALGRPQSERYAFLLRTHYVWRVSPATALKMARRAGIRIRDYHDTLAMAHVAMREQLDQTEHYNRTLVRTFVKKLLDMVVAPLENLGTIRHPG